MAERSALVDKIGESKSGKGLVDPELWHACAGSQVQVPQVGASVIYFPQGHGEYASSPPNFPEGLRSSTIACRVLSVKFLADAETDEVYARIALHPECAEPSLNPGIGPPSSPPSFNPSKVASFAKALTQSDANNGGGFSVPRYCAETIFPRLDYSKDPPVQIVLAKDVNGNEWKFRHIYRGTPRRHLLTTGWSNFVNQKKLVAGDAIIFLRRGDGGLCVGVRRSAKNMGARETSFAWHHPSSLVEPSSAERPSAWDATSIQGSYRFPDNCHGLSSVSRLGAEIALHKHTFARNRARVSSKSVREAATLAAAGKPFEVVFYPMATVEEFCVSAHSVRASLQQSWAPGMRFKMAMETEDASRISWFMGTVSKVEEADPVLWPNSPWKMLQVAWDEPDLLQGITRVSPWQVEVVSAIQLPSLSLSKKKIRLSQPPDMVFDGPDYLSMTSRVNGEMIGLLNPWHGHFNSFPAGMQGARHGRNYGLSFQAPKFSSTDVLLNNTYSQQEFPLMGEVLASIGSKKIVNEIFQHGRDHIQSSTLNTVKSGESPQTHISSSVAKDAEGNEGMKTTTIMLFGKVIYASQLFDKQQSQVSFDKSNHEAISDVFKPEVCDDVYQLLTNEEALPHPVKMAPLILDYHELAASGNDKAGTLEWPMQQANKLDKIASENGSYHCKVFSESDDEA